MTKSSHSINKSRWNFIWQQVILMVVLIFVIFLGGLFLFNFSRTVISPINFPTATPISATKQITTNTLPLQEIWRWRGIIGGRNSPPKIFIKQRFVIIASWVGDGSSIIALDTDSGNVIWAEDVFSLESLNVDDERVYIGESQYVKANSIETGKLLWTGVQQSIHKHGSLFVYPNEENLEVYDIDLSKHPRNKQLYILNSRTGETLDIINWPNIFWRQEEIYYTTPWIGGFQSHLSAEAKEPGTILWQIKLKDSPRLWPTIVDGIMYLDAGDIYALDTKTGEFIWQFEATEPVVSARNGVSTTPGNNQVSRIAHNDNIIFVIRSNGAIVGLNARTGEEVGTIEIEPSPDYFNNQGSFQDTYYLIAASDKYVAAYYSDSQELIVFERTDGTP